MGPSILRECLRFNIRGRPLGFLLELLDLLLYLPLLEDFFVGVPVRDGGEPMSSSPLRSSDPGTIGGNGKLSKPFLADDEGAEEGCLCSLLLRLLLLLLLPLLWRCE